MCSIRYDLIPAQGINEVSKAFTEKLSKYPENFWKYGLSWTDVLSSLKKHLNEFELGHDYNDAGILHMADVAAQALILCDYYTSAPHKDNRIVAPVHRPKIACDIDDVCLNFIGAFEERYNMKLNPYWNSTYSMKDKLDELSKDKDFWVNLPVLHKPTFEPYCYITSRSIPIEWTMESLEKNGFPTAPVYSVPWNESKINLLKEHNIDILIDDKPANYKDAIDNGIFCYLMDAPHNSFYKVPEHRRIFDLNLSF